MSNCTSLPRASTSQYSGICAFQCKSRKVIRSSVAEPSLTISRTVSGVPFICTMPALLPGTRRLYVTRRPPLSPTRQRGTQQLPSLARRVQRTWVNPGRNEYFRHRLSQSRLDPRSAEQALAVVEHYRLPRRDCALRLGEVDANFSFRQGNHGGICRFVTIANLGCASEW